MIRGSVGHAVQVLRSTLAPVEYRYQDWAVRRRLKRVLAKVEGLDDPSSVMLAAALRATTAPPRHEERALTNPIERVRRALLHSTDAVAPWGDPAGPARKPKPVRVLVRRMSKQPIWGRFLLHLVRVASPRRALELGAAFGLSGAYQAAGLRLSGGGELVTIEGNPWLARATATTLEHAGLASVVSIVQGSFSDVLPGVLQERGPVGYAFIDGHHDEEATVGYFRQIAGHLEPPGVLVFDDIRWSPGMWRAWRQIADDQAVDCSLDLGSLGVCVLRT